MFGFVLDLDCDYNSVPADTVQTSEWHFLTKSECLFAHTTASIIRKGTIL